MNAKIAKLSHSSICELARLDNANIEYANIEFVGISSPLIPYASANRLSVATMATMAGPMQIAAPASIPLARDRAFGTPEMLEAILLALPPRDLLLAQRVSTTWRDAIVGSISCQRALFLFPCDAKAMPSGHEVVQLGAHILQIQVSNTVGLNYQKRLS